MVSIPHYEDMSPKEIYDSLDLMWWASEKLDGSSLLFGINDAGEFYTQRKGGQPCYSLEDWGDECWASTYQLAFTFSGMLVDALVKEGILKPGQNISAEIIDSRIPNTIPYMVDANFHGQLIITDTNFDTTDEFFTVVDNFTAKWRQNVTRAFESGVRRLIYKEHFWIARVNPQIPRELTAARLYTHASKFKRVLEHWFHQSSDIEGFTVLEVLEISLSKKSPKCGDRNWADLRKLLMAKRTELRDVMRSMTLMFKEIVYRVLVLEQPSTVGAGSYKEGVVVKTPTGMFKIVDQESFKAANRFTHLIKYWIVGGRRPAKSSFLSRTKDWPKEKRLARLDQLRQRYANSHYSLHHKLAIGGKETLLVYSGDLHARTLGMFYDTRKRIEDGR